MPFIYKNIKKCNILIVIKEFNILVINSIIQKIPLSLNIFARIGVGYYISKNQIDILQNMYHNDYKIYSSNNLLF